MMERKDQEIIHQLLADEMSPANTTVEYLVGKFRVLQSAEQKLVQDVRQMEGLLAESRTKVIGVRSQLDGYASDLIFWQTNTPQLLPPDTEGGGPGDPNDD